MIFDFSKVGSGQGDEMLPEARGPALVVIEQQEVAVAGNDFMAAKAAFELFDAMIDEVIVEAEAFRVGTEDDAREATERIGKIKTFAKRIDDRRKEIIADADSFVRKTNQVVKPRRDKLESAESKYKKALSDFNYRKELERREIERRQREEQKRLQEAIDKEAKQRGVESVTVAPVAVQQKQGPTRSDSAVASAVMVWRHEVVDPKAVPREYLMIDDSAIKQAIRAGIREIAGVRIFEEAEMRVRRVG